MVEALEVEELDRLDDALQDAIDDLAENELEASDIDLSGLGDPSLSVDELRKDIARLKANPGDYELKDKFSNRWHGVFSHSKNEKVKALEHLIATQRAADVHRESIVTGFFNPDTKQKSLDDLVERVSNVQDLAPLTDPKAKWTVSNAGENLKKLNVFGKLVELYDPLANTGFPSGFDPQFPPIPTLFLGAQAAGFPHDHIFLITGTPLAPFPPVADVLGVTQSGQVTIINPETNGSDVQYLVGSSKFSLEAGKEKQHSSVGSVVRFNTGKGKDLKYRLSEGVYRWKLEEKEGWNLFKDVAKVTIDNSMLTEDFRYLLNGETKTLAAGEIATHKSSNGVEIRFDRGDGGEPTRKRLETGTYYVAIDPNEQRLDLFDKPIVDESVPEPAELAQFATLIKQERRGSARRAEAFEGLLKRLRGDATIGSFAGSAVEKPAGIKSLLEQLNR